MLSSSWTDWVPSRARSAVVSPVLAAVAVLAVALLAGVAVEKLRAGSPDARVITGGTFGVSTTYDHLATTGCTTRCKGGGDTWFNTWSDDGNIYAISNDTSALNGTCDSGIAVNELTGADPTQLSEPYVNCMTGFGRIHDNSQNPDGCTWKSGGITSVDGVLYLAVARQIDGECRQMSNDLGGEQPSRDASIVMSTDHGRTWSNPFGVTGDAAGAAPQWDAAARRVQAMWPGSTFAAPFFVGYGQDDDPASTADGGDQYVYAVSNDGYAYDGSYLVLGRVPRSEIADLNVADWQYYVGAPGGDGNDPGNWSSDPSAATHVLTAPHQISQPNIQYYPSLHRYVMVNFYYPYSTSWPNAGTASQSNFAFYEAPHPWGPWTRFLDKPTSLTICYLDCRSSNSEPLGLYDPAPVPKFIRMGGLSNVIFTSGDFTHTSRYGEPYLYSLHVLPLTLSVFGRDAVDDTSKAITYSAGWSPPTYQTFGSDYFDGTAHTANTAGASASYTFTGSSIEWIGSTNKDHGYATVSIDGGPPATVDSYSAASARQATLFERTGLPPGRHTITITVTGNRNPASTGTAQDVDAFVTA